MTTATKPAAKPKASRTPGRKVKPAQEQPKPTGSRPGRTATGKVAAKPSAKTAAKKSSDTSAATAEPTRENARKYGWSARDAAEAILRARKSPMKVAEIAREIVDVDLAPSLKGKTPEATIGAQLYTACKGEGSRFVKVDRGIVDLRELNPRGAKKRPAKGS